MDPHHTATAGPSSQPILGLALGGGGARGLAHVGVLKVLDEAGIRPDVVAGTSMGGLIGGAYAAGFTARAIEREVVRLTPATQLVQLVDRIPSFRAVFSGRRFEAYLSRTLGADLTFADLRRRLAVSTVDLNTGREVVLRAGAVVPALRATMSIPGVFAAVERNGRRLVDGGVLNNVPTDHARALGADLVLAVDVLPAFSPHVGEGTAPEAVHPLELPLAPPGVRDIWEAAFISIGALTAYNLRRCPADLVVRPDLSPTITVLTGYTRAEVAIAAGEEAMRAVLPDLRALLESPAEKSTHTT
jgi:NTE family protein